MNHVRSSNSSWLKEKQQTFGENKIYIENEFDMIIKEGRKIQTYCWWWCLSSLFSVAGLGLMGCWGIIIYYPTFITLVSLWSLIGPLRQYWPVIGQLWLSFLPAGDTIAWLSGHGRHEDRWVVTDILTIFWHFSLISPVWWCPHVTWPDHFTGRHH